MIYRQGTVSGGILVYSDVGNESVMSNENWFGEASLSNG